MKIRVAQGIQERERNIFILLLNKFVESEGGWEGERERDRELNKLIWR